MKTEGNEQREEHNHTFAIDIIYMDGSIDDKVGTCLGRDCGAEVDLRNYSMIPDNYLLRTYRNKKTNETNKIHHKIYEKITR